MIPAIREEYNKAFRQENYDNFIAALSNLHPGQLDFRVAESPVFVSKEFTDKMIAACEHIVDVITTKEYIEKTRKAIPPHLLVPNQDNHPDFIAFDFGICLNDQNELEPQLIEMQGFPSLFAYQVVFPELHKQYLYQPEGFTNYLNGYTKQNYIELLRRIIIADEDPENVILLEIFPEKQKTRIDFHCTEDYLGIKTVCLTKLIQQDNKLFYINDGRKLQVKRIYNRLIFDDLFQQSPDVQEKGKIFTEHLDLTWVPHPNWFYTLSKYTLPFINHTYVPKTQFLSDLSTLPADLDNYVVKPLFSFAGQGVIIDVTKKDIEQIKDPENWIIQKKVNYASVIETPGEKAKAEIRIFYFWDKNTPRPVATNNLARLSKGKMVGVRYNKDKDWVGGSFALFEQ